MTEVTYKAQKKNSEAPAGFEPMTSAITEYYSLNFDIPKIEHILKKIS